MKIQKSDLNIEGTNSELVWVDCPPHQPRLTSTVRSTDVGELGCVVTAGQTISELENAIELPDTVSSPGHLVHHTGVKTCHRLHSTGYWITRQL